MFKFGPLTSHFTVICGGVKGSPTRPLSDLAADLESLVSPEQDSPRQAAFLPQQMVLGYWIVSGLGICGRDGSGVFGPLYSSRKRKQTAHKQAETSRPSAAAKG